jgi:hypothetical protein
MMFEKSVNPQNNRLSQPGRMLRELLFPVSISI